MKRYAIATVLAVGLLALARAAEAKIVYTPANVKIGGVYNLDLNNDGVTDLAIGSVYVHVPPCLTYSYIYETPASGNGAEGAPPAALNQGDQIGPTQTYYGGRGTMEYFSYFCSRQSHSGNWWNVTNRYLGLMFQINGETHYGWARLNFKSVPFKGDTATLTGYAYETIARMPINAGQTSGAADYPALSPDPANPEDTGPGASVTNPTHPASLAALATPIQLAAQDQQEHHKKHTHYTVTSLGSLGGTNCCITLINNNRGWVDGTSNLAGDQSFHPFLWRDGKMQDLGTLGGPNAGPGQMNEIGDVTVAGDTGVPDPLGEDACGFGTHQTCLSFVWHNGRRTLIPTLGGNNGNVAKINNRGRVLAFAETSTQDPACLFPQVLRHEAFIWHPQSGEIDRLPPLAGDSVSAAFDMNDAEHAVGLSGPCGNQMEDNTTARHAVLWKDGQPTDLGNLGGGTIFNVAFSVNNRDQVVGLSFLPGNTTVHGFLWTEDDGMRDLGTLPGDSLSFAGPINNKGQVGITSCDVNNNCRAAIWQDGVMTDLNTLIAPGSPLFLVGTGWINDRGEIVAAAFDQSTGATVPVLLTPCDEKHAHDEGCKDGAAGTAVARGETNQRPNVVLPENVRRMLRQRLGIGRFGIPLTRPQ
jgi:probable HAF family extracellular repeat protein